MNQAREMNLLNNPILVKAELKLLPIIRPQNSCPAGEWSTILHVLSACQWSCKWFQGGAEQSHFQVSPMSTKQACVTKPRGFYTVLWKKPYQTADCSPFLLAILPSSSSGPSHSILPLKVPVPEQGILFVAAVQHLLWWSWVLFLSEPHR